MAVKPDALADDFSIGATLRLVDHLNPSMTTDPSGNFCLIMNFRFTGETAPESSVSGTSAPAMAA